MKAIFARLAILLALLVSGAALAREGGAPAQDHIVGRAVLEDPEGTLSIEDVTGRAFAPAGPILARGYTPSTHWLRLTVRPGDGGPLVLRIRPTYLDRVELYEPDANAPGGWKRDVTGDRTPFLERDLPSVALGFTIWPTGPETTYYLRLSTSSTSLLHAEALLPQVAALADLQIHVDEIFILGLLLCILLWTASDFLARRDPVVGCFAINQLFFISYNVLIMGYGALIFPHAAPGFVDRLTSVVIIATPLFSILTNRLLLRQFDLHPIARWMLDTLLALAVVALGLLAAGAAQQALALNAYVVMLIVPLLPVLALSTRREAPPGRRTLGIVYTIQALSLLFTMLPLLGLLPATTWNLDANIIHGLLSDLPLFVLLALRSREARRTGIEVQMNLDLTRRELELQRRQFDMQNRFMAMLTHELRTPLSVIRLAVGTAKIEGEPRRLIDSAFGNMAGIIDRCSLADRMEQQRLDVVREPVDIEALLRAIVTANTQSGRVTLSAGPLPSVDSDEQLVAVALHNLVDNALKYSPEGSTVEVTALIEENAPPDGRAAATPGIRVAVENSCGRTGVPDPARLFEKFHRGPQARTTSGSGLGLYIVQGITDLLGGSVSYQFSEGRARFSLWLPCSA
ncbi:7TM-DISM domain-containing protein [Ancylobacter dichloromethanicus]|uniref:histidine kinase n=1 Tax=Ancylobacter dichloromethanicus TaxID=518825 RepID=A0A9W6N076_9HYPH|nr:7TM-DISM domain-containing protein [Ancylobacter dichloromethanicus]GLK73509.1 hybrid sensor histidine kinase/response regulator [Ancylobacter dichloromethanicus]